MNPEKFKASLAEAEPPAGLSAPLRQFTIDDFRMTIERRLQCCCGSL